MLKFFKEKILKPTNEMCDKLGIDRVREYGKCELCGELTPVELLSGIGNKEVCQECQSKFE